MNHVQATEQTQVTYARIAGFTYLLLIVLYMSGEFLISGIVGSSDFAAAAQNVAASERLYRFALVLQTLTPLCTVVLAYALYVAVRSVNERLAQMAMFWRLGESFIGATIVIFSFLKLRIYTSAAGTGDLGAEQWQASLALVRSAHNVGFNFSTLFFSIGSTVFFYLFLKASYLPKALSIFGIFASITVALTSLANLAFPEYESFVQYGWAPIFLSEVVTGLWLLFRGVRVR